jgi:ABC-type glycerol-3-phosphate transport system substrate-binding protein
MMLQYKVNFYNEDLTNVAFGSDTNAMTALELFASFGLPSQKNYSWNQYLADPESEEKEIATFANGQLSMMLGYSYVYEDIRNEIQNADTPIDIDDVKIQEIPQAYDPDTSAETREAYASYFVPTVSRTTENADIAWDFLGYLVDKENLSYYNETTNRPSALRSLIDEQMTDPIYGAFAAQVGYAESLPMADPEKYEEFALLAIEQMLDTARTEDVLRNLADQIQDLIPEGGVKPTYVATE